MFHDVLQSINYLISRRYTAYKIHIAPLQSQPIRLKKVCYKVSLCENSQRHSCKAFSGLSNRAKMVRGESRILREKLAETDQPPSQSLMSDQLARSASAVTPTANSSINTNRKSSTSFPMSLRRTVYVALSPHRVAQKHKMLKSWTTICDNFERYEIRCQLVLITNRKSYTGFRLVPTSVTLNDLERRKSRFCVFHQIR